MAYYDLMTYRLHYAPDNASLIIRLVLEELGQPYETVLVDRRIAAQRSEAHLALNPHGLIPVLETPHGPLFETAAILLWLCDRHVGLAPAPDAPERGAFLKWLFFVSNTLHTELRISFYPEKFIGGDPADQAALSAGMRASLRGHVQKLESLAASAPPWLAPPSALALYIGVCLRWLALYPASGPRWFELEKLPHLCALASQVEQRHSMAQASVAEGLGKTPLTAPCYATPPEGSAT